MTTVKRKQKDGKIVDVTCLAAVAFYNKHMKAFTEKLRSMPKQYAIIFSFVIMAMNETDIC